MGHKPWDQTVVRGALSCVQRVLAGYDLTVDAVTRRERRAMAVAAAARTANEVIERTRRSAGSLLNRLHLELRKIEARSDPEGELWAERMRLAAKDPIFADRVLAQPDPEAIVDEWHKSQPA
jgi:hypothetical protein